MDQEETRATAPGGRNRIRTGDPSSDDAGHARAHIQRVALGLFIEKGYDKTSLREIAEELGVTKAALYYHFPSKEDIVNSLIEERIAAVDELIAWAQRQPDPARMRLEFVRRYATGLHDAHRHEDVMRFLERNQTLVDTLRAGQRVREQMRRVFDLLIDPDEPLAQQLRRAMAIISIHAAWVVLRERTASAQERHLAALDVSLELMRGANEIANG